MAHPRTGGDQPDGGTSMRRELLTGRLLLGSGGAGLVAAVVLIGLTLTDVRIGGPETVLYLGVFLLAFLVGAYLAGTAVGIAVEVVRPHWTDFHERHHLLLGAAALVVLGGAAVALRWAFIGGHLSTAPELGLILSLVVGVVGGGVVTYLALSPRFLSPRLELGYLGAGLASIGMLAATITIVVALLVAAVVRSDQVQHAAAPPPITTVTGTYVALGDSYSAGEGLRPFDPNTGPVSDVDGGVGNACHRSSQAYSQWLRFEPPDGSNGSAAPGPPGEAPVSPPIRFVACSGAVVADATTPYQVDEAAQGRDDLTVRPQLDGVHPEVGLVTLTMGGNDLLFAQLLRRCALTDGCWDEPFHPHPIDEHNPDRHTVDYEQVATRIAARGGSLEAWAQETANELRAPLRAFYDQLRHDYPNARVVVIGYPHLFPRGDAGFSFSDCDVVLRYYSKDERNRLDDLQDQLTDLMYEQAVGAGIEFVSPQQLWAGHEPCGAKGQYTNSMKPIISADVVDGGSFHPNVDGQKTLARAVACYLNDHPSAPDAHDPAKTPRSLAPEAFADLTPAGEVGLVPAPGTDANPLAC